MFLKVWIEVNSKQLFGFLLKPQKADFDAIIDGDTLVTHDMPECPLLDGSLAFSEKHKVTLDLLHYGGTSECSVYIDIFMNNVRDFHSFLKLCKDTECTRLRLPPQRTRFSRIFGLIQYIYPLSMAEAHTANASPNTSQERRAIEINISADKKGFVQDKDVGLYSGFIEGEVFIVITFRPEDGAVVGVNALMIQ